MTKSLTANIRQGRDALNDGIDRAVQAIGRFFSAAGRFIRTNGERHPCVRIRCAVAGERAGQARQAHPQRRAASPSGQRQAGEGGLRCPVLCTSAEELAMIARRWHGRVPAAKADDYLELMSRQSACPTIARPRATAAPGASTAAKAMSSTSRCSLCGRTKRRSGASPATTWPAPNIMTSIPDFLLELEPEVTHFDVVDGLEGQCRIAKGGRLPYSPPLTPFA